jgi:hypothetical protein
MLQVSGTVALLCAAILVLFTDIEDSFLEWIHCDLQGRSGQQDRRTCR